MSETAYKHMMVRYPSGTNIEKMMDEFSTYGIEIFAVIESRRWFHRGWVLFGRRPIPSPTLQAHE